MEESLSDERRANELWAEDSDSDTDSGSGSGYGSGYGSDVDSKLATIKMNLLEVNSIEEAIQFANKYRLEHNRV